MNDRNKSIPFCPTIFPFAWSPGKWRHWFPHSNAQLHVCYTQRTHTCPVNSSSTGLRLYADHKITVKKKRNKITPEHSGKVGTSPYPRSFNNFTSIFAPHFHTQVALSLVDSFVSIFMSQMCVNVQCWGFDVRLDLDWSRASTLHITIAMLWPFLWQ